MAIIIPYVKQTWTDGSGGGTPVSAARLGVIEEGVLDVSQAPAVRVTKAALQTITTGTITAIQFDTERFDQAGGASSTQHDNVTNNTRLTCLYAGVYLITAHGQWSASPATGSIYIRLNGTTMLAENTVVADYRTMSVSTIYSLAVNDYVEMMVQQQSGSNKDITKAGNESPEFGMVRVA